MEAHNATLVRLVARRLSLTEGEANAKLMGRIRVPKRKVDGRTNTMVAYRYLKRTVSHFYEGLGKAAVNAFLSSIKRSTGMGRNVSVRGSRTRTSVELSAEEASFLLANDRFILETFGHRALLAGVHNMFASINAGHLFSESSMDSEAIDTVVCRFAHFALVVTKVREHLKLRIGGGATANPDNPGVNEGHRQPWERELVSLDAALWRTPQTRNGLRIVDADDRNRASVIVPLASEGGAAAAAGGAPAGGVVAAGGGAPAGDAVPGSGTADEGNTVDDVAAANALMAAGAVLEYVH